MRPAAGVARDDTKFLLHRELRRQRGAYDQRAEHVLKQQQACAKGEDVAWRV